MSSRVLFFDQPNKDTINTLENCRPTPQHVLSGQKESHLHKYIPAPDPEGNRAERREFKKLLKKARKKKK